MKRCYLITKDGIAEHCNECIKWDFQLIITLHKAMISSAAWYLSLTAYIMVSADE